MHLDEGSIQRLIDGERAADARAHADACAACRALVATASREAEEIAALLGALDTAAPRVSVDAVVARAHRSTRARTRARWAAGIALALVAGGAYAFVAPGSPLRAWLERDGGGNAPRPPAVSPPAPTAPGTAGIAVAPGPRFSIVIPAPATGARAIVSLTDDADLTIRTSSGAASFTSAADHAIVELHGAATLDVRVPRAARRVEVVLDGRRIFLKDGPRVVTSAALESGAYALSLSPPP